MPLQTDVRNRLLRLMPGEDFDRLAAHLRAVDLPLGMQMIEPDRPILHAHFPERGVGSITTVSDDGAEVESGLFGWDGVSGATLALGVPATPNRVLIQVAGDGWRIAAAPFARVLDESPTLRAFLLRYVQAMIVQTSYTALSNAVHPVDKRLARWILMCADRVDGDEIALTHEFLAIMLAVRRPSVTTSLHVLEGEGLIRATRGCVTLRDRAALERFAGDSYGRPEAAYRELIGPLA